MRYKLENIAKNGPTCANLEPQEKKPSFPTGYANPTLYSVRSVIPVLLYENPFK